MLRHCPFTCLYEIHTCLSYWIFHFSWVLSSSVTRFKAPGFWCITHITMFVESINQVPYRNRHGLLSQNVMATCAFDLEFIHIQVGWEGSASEAIVLRATEKDDLKVPRGI